MNKQGCKSYGLFGKTNSNLTSDKVVIKELKFSDIELHFRNNEIIIPQFQREIAEDKVKEIIHEIENNKKLSFTSH